MANQSKLKAWLRYDGTGTVVLSGPILSINKPKDGNWKQMNADRCCIPPTGVDLVTETGAQLTTENGDFLILN